MSKHTPGPWEWWTSNSVRRLTGGDGKDGSVLLACAFPFFANIQVSEADARLIAAAPDLLEALEGIAEINPELPMGLIEQVHAAIAKATGEAA